MMFVIHNIVIELFLQGSSGRAGLRGDNGDKGMCGRLGNTGPQGMPGTSIKGEFGWRG